MGIGVSFRGRDGHTRKFDLDGVPKVGDEAAQILGAQQSSVRDVLSKKLLPDVTFLGGGGGGGDSHRVKLTDSDNSPGPLDEKMDPGGSVTVSKKGVCLKGDNVPAFGDTLVYGKKNGVHGFHGLVAYDSGTEGTSRLGIVGSGGPDAIKDASSGPEDTICQVITRLNVSPNELGDFELFQFERDIRKTAFGRIVSIGEERRSAVGFLSIGGGGGAPDLDVVTGMSFKIEDNKLKATLDKTNLHTGETSTEDVDICDVHDLDVVTNTDYTNPDFTQSKQSVTVIGAAPSGSDNVTNVFTTTPLDDELTS